MAYETMIYEKKGHIGYVTLNRPSLRRGSLNGKPSNELLGIRNGMIKTR